MFEEYFIQDRLAQIDAEFLEYEIAMLRPEHKTLLMSLLEKQDEIKRPVYKENTHNSILLYITGLTNDFDFSKARSDMKGGAAPDYR